MFIIHIMTIILIIRIMAIIRIMVIMHIILIMLLFQVRINLGLADHVWQNKRAAIAQEVDVLGLQFRQAIRDGWLKYIKATYAAQPEEMATGPSIGQGKVVVEDD
jgi:hypothetical protein